MRITVLVQSLTITGILVASAAGCGSDNPPPPPLDARGNPVRTCASDGDCGQPNPYCYGGYCVQCIGPNNCGGRQCSADTHVCVQCASNADCGGPLPYCNPSTYQCVMCVGPGNCPMGLTCNAATNRCQATCATDANCTPLARYCSPTLGVCVSCTADTNCGGGAPYCNPSDGTCVECLTDANCNGGNGGGNQCRGFRCR